MSDAALLPVLQPPADGVQPRAVVFEILRPGDRIPGPQQMLRQCGQGPYFVLKAHMLVVGDGAALAGMFIPAAAEIPTPLPRKCRIWKMRTGRPVPGAAPRSAGPAPRPAALLSSPSVFFRRWWKLLISAIASRDRVSVLRRHGIEFPDAALAVHFFGRMQIGVQLVQNGVELLYPRGRNPPRRWRTPGTQRGPPCCGSAPRAAALHPWHSRASHIAGRRDS